MSGSGLPLCIDPRLPPTYMLRTAQRCRKSTARRELGNTRVIYFIVPEECGLVQEKESN